MNLDWLFIDYIGPQSHLLFYFFPFLTEQTLFDLNQESINWQAFSRLFNVTFKICKSFKLGCKIPFIGFNTKDRVFSHTKAVSPLLSTNFSFPCEFSFFQTSTFKMKVVCLYTEDSWKNPTGGILTLIILFII